MASKPDNASLGSQLSLKDSSLTLVQTVRMRSHLGLVLCVIAGFQLLGGHWAVLQTAAWVGMVIDYSKSDGVEAGITKTFDGKHPCQLCLSITKNKQKEGKQTANISSAKLYLVCQTSRWSLTPPAAFWQLATSFYPFRSAILQPSVPPPRQYLG
jgi:hypothetical protein